MKIAHESLDENAAIGEGTECSWRLRGMDFTFDAIIEVTGPPGDGVSLRLDYLELVLLRDKISEHLYRVREEEKNRRKEARVRRACEKKQARWDGT